MSAAGAVLCGCCGATCDYTLCEHCPDGMPVTFTITISGVTISSNELYIDPLCWRFTSTSDANGTFCLTNGGDPGAYCERFAGISGSGVENGGEECEFSDTITNGLGITFSRVDATTFSITIFAPDFGGSRFVVFYATFTSDICYLDGEVVANTLTSGDVADNEDDGYDMDGATNYNLGYGGSVTITACCP